MAERSFVTLQRIDLEPDVSRARASEEFIDIPGPFRDQVHVRFTRSTKVFHFAFDAAGNPLDAETVRCLRRVRNRNHYQRRYARIAQKRGQG